MDHTSLVTALSVGSTIVVTIATLIVIPLVNYIIKQKDSQVESMRRSLERAFKRVEELEKDHTCEYTALNERLHRLEQSAAVLKTEVDIVRELRDDIGKLTGRMDGIVNELALLKAVISERGGSYRQGLGPIPGLPPHG